MRVEASLQGLAGLISEGLSAADELARNLDASAQDAAEKGLVAFTDVHPYTDRTFNLTASARVEMVADTTAGHYSRDMVWGGDDSEAPYAEYVERMDHYAFTPVAAQEAERILADDVAHVVDIYTERLSGR